MPSEIRGLLAALTTPRTPAGDVDLDALERNADFALTHGARGVVPCGGTGEYFDLTEPQRRGMLERLVPVARGRGLVVTGVGASSADGSVRLARHALEAGADAVLLPSPYFYRYEAGDLLHFFRKAARAIEGPVLLYNLAAFVSPIPDQVVVDLLQAEPNIVGIKDSSGSLRLLRRLAGEGVVCGARIQGHDVRLAESLQEGLADAAISGPASVVPEAGAAVFAARGAPEAFATAREYYGQFLEQASRFPYPWALKWVAEWRGLGVARLPFPISSGRKEQRDQFRAWFDEWSASLPPPTA